jgi:hypothetical protein
MDQQKRDRMDESSTRHQNQEPAEGSRENVNTGDERFRDSGSDSERGMGNSGERNSGNGISNRGMDRSTEQQDLPSRGSTRESDR